MKKNQLGTRRSRTSLGVVPWIMLISLLMLAPCWAQRPPVRPMLPAIDKRLADTPIPAPSDEKLQAAESLRQLVPTLQVAFEPVSGSPKSVSATDGFLTGPDGQGATLSAATRARFAANDPDRVTKAFLSDHRDLFGHGPEALDGARVARDYITPNNGLHTVVWEQQVDGIAVFEGVLISHTTRKGELVSIASQFVPTPERAAARGTANSGMLISKPAVTATRAVALAAQNVEVTLDETNVVATGEITPGPEQRQKFKSPGLKGETEVKLIWLPMTASTMRLC